MFTVKVPENTTDKLVEMIGETTDAIQTTSMHVNTRVNEMSEEVKVVGLQLTGLATMGMIAFSLISVVALSALLIASSKK